LVGISDLGRQGAHHWLALDFLRFCWVPSKKPRSILSPWALTATPRQPNTGRRIKTERQDNKPGAFKKAEEIGTQGRGKSQKIFREI